MEMSVMLYYYSVVRQNKFDNFITFVDATDILVYKFKIFFFIRRRLGSEHSLKQIATSEQLSDDTDNSDYVLSCPLRLLHIGKHKSSNKFSVFYQCVVYSLPLQQHCFSNNSAPQPHDQQLRTKRGTVSTKYSFRRTRTVAVYWLYHLIVVCQKWSCV